MPFLLNATIRKHDQSYEKIDKEFARIVRNKFYVDDLNCGVNDVEEAFDLYKKMKFRLGEASFVIRKWRTNDETLRKLIQEYEGNDNARYKTDEKSESYEKVLGVEWNEYQDIFIFRVKKMLEDVTEIVPSARRILSIISSIYDPAGFLKPLTVMLKLLFQGIRIFL